MDVRPKHMENLQWSSHVNEGWWGLLFWKKDIQEREDLRRYYICHFVQYSSQITALSLYPSASHSLQANKTNAGIYKHHWNYMQLCQQTTGLCFSFCSSLAVRCTLPKNIKHYSCFQTLVPTQVGTKTSWFLNKEILSFDSSQKKEKKSTPHLPHLIILI
jgi:hypothetical protein